jgi:hypothetical protein
MSGCSGQFLRLIISMFLSDKVFIIKNFEKGSITKEVLFEHHPQFESNIYNPNKSIVDHNVRFDRDLPWTFAEHSTPNWDKLYKVFPNLTNIIIAMDKNMFQRYLLNMEIKNKHVPHTEVEYLQNHLKKSMTLFKVDEYRYPLDITHEYPKEYNIVKLPYYDLIHKKDSVLSTLSEITGKPIKNHIVQTYDNYLKAQHDLYPWFDDSITS